MTRIAMKRTNCDDMKVVFKPKIKMKGNHIIVSIIFSVINVREPLNNTRFVADPS